MKVENYLDRSNEGELCHGRSEDNPTSPRDHHVPEDRGKHYILQIFDISWFLLDADRNVDNRGLKVVIPNIFQVKIHNNSVEPILLLVCPV